MDPAAAGRTRARAPLGRLDHLTYRGNSKATRHGWLRLTPAYSVKLVESLLQDVGARNGTVLDPFCGTGTTALACAERGIPCDTTDINPFLVWFARAKTRPYSEADLAQFERGAEDIARSLSSRRRIAESIPPLHRIEKWWPEQTLSALGRGSARLQRLQSNGDLADPALDLLKIAFCQTLIARARVSFGHQSMSFKRGAAPDDADSLPELTKVWEASVGSLSESARATLHDQPRVLECDARSLTTALKPGTYARVITSPPYPNRMSYIRELRPYMYWLRFLNDGRGAGELDWRAIGGTWGVATSNLSRWRPPANGSVPHRGFATVVRSIAQTSPLLARYVEKYFFDMLEHSRAVFEVIAPGGSIHYIVGNSKFYDVLLPAERIFASLFRSAGFAKVSVEAIRKRSSKKELFEYLISGEKP